MSPQERQSLASSEYRLAKKQAHSQAKAVADAHWKQKYDEVYIPLLREATLKRMETISGFGTPLPNVPQVSLKKVDTIPNMYNPEPLDINALKTMSSEELFNTMDLDEEFVDSDL